MAATSALTSARPKPGAFARQHGIVRACSKGWPMRASTSAGMPMPWSRHRQSPPSRPSRVRLTVTVPSGRENFTALDRRLIRICLQARASATTIQRRPAHAPPPDAAARRRPGSISGTHLPHSPSDRCRGSRPGKAPGLDLGQVQNVGHQAEQMVARLVDQLGIFLIARRPAAPRSCAASSRKSRSPRSTACAVRGSYWPGIPT